VFSELSGLSQLRQQVRDVSAKKEELLALAQTPPLSIMLQVSGPDAHGVADFPRLAGQHRQYILKQLASFQSNMRNVAIRHGVALNLRETEMQSVAAYLEAQP
jgi:hypothetical protein